MSRVTIETLGNPRIAVAKGNIKSIEGIGILVTAMAKDLCPVDKGPLRNTIMYKTPDAEGGFNESPGEKAPDDQKLTEPVKKNQGIVGTGSDHWYPEFGTVKMIAQPFLRPAVATVVQNQSAQKVVKEYNTEAMAKEFAIRKAKVVYRSGS
jgi:hypothetical protein